MSELESFIKNKEWETLSKNYSPNFLAEILSFSKALVLSRKILENEKWDDRLQTFAINLIKAIKIKYSEEWGI